MKIQEMEKWIRSVDERLENHLIHVASDIAHIKSDIDWIKRFFWLVAGVSVTAIGGAFLGLILK